MRHLDLESIAGQILITISSQDSHHWGKPNPGLVIQIPDLNNVEVDNSHAVFEFLTGDVTIIP